MNKNIINKNTKKWLRIITSLIAILSIFCIVFLWDNINEAKYPFATKTNGIKVDEKAGEYQVIIDSQFARLIILKNGQIKSILEDPEHEQSKKMYYKALIRNNKIYVHDVTMRGHTQFIENESICAFDLDGNYLGKVYEIDYGDEILDAYPPRIVDYDIIDGTGAVLYADRLNSTVHIMSFVPEIQENPGFGEYYESINFKSAINDIFIFDGAFDIQEGYVAITTLYGDVYVSNRYHNNQSIYKIHDHSDNYALSIFYDDNHQLVINPEILEADTVLEFTPWLTLKTLALWFSLWYLILFVVIKTITIFIALKKTKQLKKLRQLSIALASVVGILLICIFYSYYTITDNYNTKASNISVQASNIAQLQSDYLNDCINDFSTTGQVSFEHFKKLHDNLTTITENYSKIDESAQFTLYVYGNDGNMYLLITSALYYPSGLPYMSVYDVDDEIEMMWETNGSFLCVGFRNNYIASVEILYDENNNVLGYFSAETNYELFLEKNISNFLSLFATLLLISTSILLISYELFRMFKSFKARKRAIFLREKVPEIYLSRILYFCIIFAFEVDSSLMVLVAKDMLAGTTDTDINFLLSLPAFVHSAGMVIGMIIFVLLASKFSIKKLGFISSIFLIGMYLVTAYAVYTCNFWMYLIGKLFANIFLSQIFSIPNGLITHVQRERTIAKISIEMTVASLSAGILAMMFAGYIAEFISNWCIYVLAAIPCVGAAILFITMFSNTSIKSLERIKNVKRKDNNNNETSPVKLSYKTVKQMFKFYFSKNTFTFVFCVLGITTITFAFRSYLFPLLGDSYGWDKATISNVIVIANIVVFLIIPVITNMTKGIDYWKISIWCMVATGVVFAILMVRSIPAIVIFVMFVITIFNKLINSYISVLLVREGDAQGINKTKANVILLILRDGFGAIKAPISSAFLSIGVGVLYGVYAIASIAGGAIFGVVTKNSAMNGKNKKKRTNRYTGKVVNKKHVTKDK